MTGCGTGLSVAGHAQQMEQTMNGLREDIRYVTRSLVRSPTLTLVIVLTLALGIGLNTAIFSVVRGVLLKPLAFRDPSRLMLVSGRLTRPDNRPTLLSGGMFSRLGAAVPAFSDVAAVAAIRQNLRGGGELPVQVRSAGSRRTSSRFSALMPHLGAGSRIRSLRVP